MNFLLIRLYCFPRNQAQQYKMDTVKVHLAGPNITPTCNKTLNDTQSERDSSIYATVVRKRQRIRVVSTAGYYEI